MKMTLRKTSRADVSALGSIQFMRRRASFFGRFASVFLSALAVLSGCSKHASVQPGLENADRAEPGAGPAAAASTDFAASLPREGGPAGYVGSKACRPCHEDQFASWHRSYHRTMTQMAAADT